MEKKMVSGKHIDVPPGKIEEICRKYGIRKLSFFGSILGNQFGPESDIDVLVEFESGRLIGFLRMAEIEIELSEVLGRKVDLRTPAELSRYFREEVCASAKVQYEKE